MKDSIVSSEIVEPYAQALMSVAQNQNLVDRFGEDVGALLTALNQSPELSQVLESPLFSADIKKNILRQISGEAVHPYVLNFLMLLVDRGRIPFLGGICRQFQSLLRDLRQTVLAEVTSAVELNDGQKDAIRQRVLGFTGAREVDLEIQIDPDLIGGVIIKVGSQVIDASLRGQLRRIGISLNSIS